MITTLWQRIAIAFFACIFGILLTLIIVDIQMLANGIVLETHAGLSGAPAIVGRIFFLFLSFVITVLFITQPTIASQDLVDKEEVQ